MFAALVAASGAFAVEAGSVAPAGNTPSAVASKQAASTKPKKRPVPLAAAASEAARATELPAASVHSRPAAPSPQQTWTGTYVGVGVSAGDAR
jgi:hypothetical protein